MSVSLSSPATKLYPARNPKGRKFTAEDLWKIARVGRPVPAPGGDWLAVPVTSYDLEKNEGKSRLWRVPVSGGAPSPLTASDAAASEPAFSPDGKRLAFVRKRDAADKAQLYVMAVDGGEAEKLTDLPLGVFDPRWLPDGKRIAFVSPLVAGSLTIEATRKRLEERDKDPVKAHVTEDRVFRFWDRWLTTGESPHIFVVDVETREVRDLTPDSTRWFDFMDGSGQYDISPDGSEIAFSASASEPPHQFLRWGVFAVPTAGGPTKNIAPTNPADDLRPRYSPDGRYLVYGKQVDPFFYADRVRLIRVDRKTGEEKDITGSWDRSPSHWEFLDAQTLVLEAEDRGRVALYALGIDGGEARSLVPQGSVAGVAPAKDGKIYFNHQDISSPAELAWTDSKGGTPKPLARFNQWFFDEIALGEVQEMEFAGADGKPVQSFIVFPPDFDPAKKWPLLQEIHGGPHGISGDLFHPRWNAHLFASPGYVVVEVNFHGSTSWGQDFAQVIQGAHGDKPFTDIMCSTDAMLATGYIDEKRMAAAGGSYGGYMVSWIAGHTDRFQCLVNHAGVYDILAQYASDVTQGRHRSYGGEPWEGLAAIDKWNPARFADGMVSPMLVIHGERDYRVPVTQGIACYNVLKGKGIPARLVYFPDENHWVLKPRNSIFWYKEVLSWLDRFLK
ncbi:MAG TPA: S9 family peptidase [Candidatus Eisenbacteria bacterium]|nr:S9 family peptidase [Candidatus Eisenbacteria bacterium]